MVVMTSILALDETLPLGETQKSVSEKREAMMSKKKMTLKMKSFW